MAMPVNVLSYLSLYYGPEDTNYYIQYFCEFLLSLNERRKFSYCVIIGDLKAGKGNWDKTEDGGVLMILKRLQLGV